jgi:hypothetical protein
MPLFSKVFARTFPHFWVLPVWLYHTTAALLTSFDFMGTFAFILLILTHADNTGHDANAVAVKALFFKNIRLLSMGFSIGSFEPELTLLLHKQHPRSSVVICFYC